MGADEDRSGTVRVEIDADGAFTVAPPPRLDGHPTDPRAERLAAARRRRDADTASDAPLRPAALDVLSESPPPTAGRVDRGRRVLLVGFAVVGVLLGLLLWGARPDAGRTASDDPIVAPTTTVVPDESETAATADVDVGLDASNGTAVELTTLRPITEVVEFRGEWFGIYGLRGSEQLVRSPDAVTWFEVDLDLPPGDIIGLGVNAGELVVANASGGGLGIGDAAPGDLSLRLWRSTDGRDFVIAEPVSVSPNSIVGFAEIADDAMVFVLQSITKEPVPEISELLVTLGATPEVADRVCQLRRRGGTVTSYALLDCEAVEIGSLTELGPADIDRLAFASELLTFRYELAITSPSMGEHIVSVAAGRLLTSVVATDEGVLTIAVDSLEGLRDPNQFFAGGLIASMQHWTPDDGFLPIEPPRQTRGWWNSEIERLDDGRVLNVIADEVFVSTAPYTDWELVQTWDEQLTPGGVRLIGGSGWVARPAIETSGIGQDRMYVARVGGEWQEIAVLGETVTGVLFATDRGLVAELATADLVEVPFGAFGEPYITPARVVDGGDPDVKPRPLESREWVFPVLTEAIDGNGYVGLSNENGSTLFFESPNGLDWDIDVLTDLPFSLFVRSIETTPDGYRLFGRLGMFDDAVFVSTDGVDWTREKFALPRGADAVELRSYSGFESVRAIAGVLGWPDDLSRSEDFVLWWDTANGEPVDVPVRPCVEPNGRCEIVSVVAVSDGMLAVHRAETNFTLSRWTVDAGWTQVPADLPLPAEAPRLVEGAAPGEIWYVSANRVLLSTDEGRTWDDRFVRVSAGDAQFVDIAKDGSVALLDAGDTYVVATDSRALAYSKAELRSLDLEAVSADGVVLTGVGRAGQALIRLEPPS